MLTKVLHVHVLVAADVYSGFWAVSREHKEGKLKPVTLYCGLPSQSVWSICTIIGKDDTTSYWVLGVNEKLSFSWTMS